MVDYKVGLAIDPNYAGYIPELVEAIHKERPYVERKTLTTPDCTYWMYIWDWGPFASEKVLELFEELKLHRHSLITISETGQVVEDIDVEDADGVDEEFYEILSWESDIATPLDRGISKERLENILFEYVSTDLKCCNGEIEHILDVLRFACGCTDTEIEKLGFGRLLELEAEMEAEDA